MAGEAARVGEAALGAQDIDEHAIAALVVKAIDRRLEDAVVVQGSAPRSRALYRRGSRECHCEQLAISSEDLDLVEAEARERCRASGARGGAGEDGDARRRLRPATAGSRVR